MREIDIRAWDENNKEMIYISDLYWFEENGVHDFGGEGDHGRLYKFMLGIGLKDKNGRKIYEGDIVEGFGEIPDRAHVVSWNDEHHGWYPFAIFTLDSMFHRNQDFSNIEVVGNLHEDPGADE